MKLVVWVDELFLNNLLITLLILWAVARFSGITFLFRRLFLAASMGSLYLVVTLAPFFRGLPSLAKLFFHFLLSFLLIYIAFGGTRKRIFRALFYLYLISFVMGGFIFGIFHLLDPSPNFQLFRLYRGDLWVLFLLFLFFLCIAGYGWKYLHELLWKGMFQILLIMDWGEEKISVKALVDTGNSLRDPLSDDPVIVVEWKALKRILPQDLSYGSSDHIFQIVPLLEKSPLSTAVRIIPYGALEGEGLLLGLRPNGITIRQGKKEYSTNNVVIALLFFPLDPKDEYQALLHPEIYQSLIES